VPAKNVEGAAAEAAELIVVLGALATHDIRKLGREHERSSISVDSSKGFDVAQEAGKVNICRIATHRRQSHKRLTLPVPPSQQGRTE